ncbi:MAG: hypothetical protein OXI41_11560 [Chloroflexota bacterium]|nr:hypothetical protein [Chloroflexota bacterium]MDE2894676.1 hypothetical protein [Chloroflexota bacterium]
MPTSREHAGIGHQSGQKSTPPGIPSTELRSSSISDQARGAVLWARREVILALFAAFIAGLGAGAAEALITWLAG